MTRGRPKGRTKYQISLSLTKQQHEWLRKQHNASALIDAFINANIAVVALTPEYIAFVEQKTKIEAIQQKLEELQANKRTFLLQGHWRKQHFKGEWIDDPQDGRYYAVENMNDPTPIDSEGEQLKHELNLMTEAINRLTAELETLRKNVANGV